MGASSSIRSREDQELAPMGRSYGASLRFMAVFADGMRAGSAGFSRHDCKDSLRKRTCRSAAFANFHRTTDLPRDGHGQGSGTGFP